MPATADYDFKSLIIQEYDAVLVPGGWAPDKLRRYPEVLDIIRTMNEQKKPIGQICHAGWVLISAGILAGKSNEHARHQRRHDKCRGTVAG